MFAPKQFAGVMLPYGGAALTDLQTRAVAAYVFMERHAHDDIVH